MRSPFALSRLVATFINGVGLSIAAPLPAIIARGAVDYRLYLFRKAGNMRAGAVCECGGVYILAQMQVKIIFG